MMRHGSARRLSTMLMYGGIALLCYVLLLLRRAERQHAKLQQQVKHYQPSARSNAMVALILLPPSRYSRNAKL